MHGDFVTAGAFLLEACLPRALDSIFTNTLSSEAELAPLADEGRLRSLVLEKFLLGPQHQRLGSLTPPRTHAVHLLRTIPEAHCSLCAFRPNSASGWGFSGISRPFPHVCFDCSFVHPALSSTVNFCTLCGCMHPQRAPVCPGRLFSP